jgi:hypothetical protein
MRPLGLTYEGRPDDIGTMRSALHRLLLACGLAAVAAVCLPSIASAAAPQGGLTVAEYDLLLAAFQRGEALEDDRNATSAEWSAMCDLMASRPTALVSAAHALCRGGVRLTQVSDGKGCASKDTRCAARGMLQTETALRSVARLLRAQRRATAQRGLTGQCALAINGPRELVTIYEAFANAMRDLRRAVLAENERMILRASARLDRAMGLGQDIEDEDSAALLASCPRV